MAWKEETFHGSWIKGISAGGCQKNNETFATNPQFKITLQDFDNKDDNCTVIVALMRKNVCGHSHPDEIAIGFEIYNVSGGETSRITLNMMTLFSFLLYHILDLVEDTFPLKKEFFSENGPSATFANWNYNDKEQKCKRDAVKRFNLKLGSYVIIPSTYEPGKEAEFLLRVFSEKSVSYVDTLEPINPVDPIDPVDPKDPPEDHKNPADLICQPCNIM